MFYSVAIARNKARHPNPTKYKAITVKSPLLNYLNQSLLVLFDGAYSSEISEISIDMLQLQFSSDQSSEEVHIKKTTYYDLF